MEVFWLKKYGFGQKEQERELNQAYVEVDYTDGQLNLRVRDARNNMVPLLKGHERSLHLIIVSADFNTFLHIHPIETLAGDFERKIELPSSNYLVFADLLPVKLDYTIKPLPLTVGEPTAIPAINWPVMAKNDSLTKKRNGKTVTLQSAELIAGESVALSFDLHGENPLLYSGASGYVVVLDEQGKRFLSVYTPSRLYPEFHVQFPEAGFYKLWAEFHFIDAGILAFPFVLEVTKADDSASKLKNLPPLII